ncbi:MAG: HAMP domain-containing histidine kinase [Candidatus Aminicenantes bacterium]|nr:HAMP domain-containing histidine kinase [Candidatus Aminicenantes bacterium]
MNRKRIRIAILLLGTAVMAFLAVQFVLVSKSLKLERKEFEFKTRLLATDVFFEIPLNYREVERVTAEMMRKSELKKDSASQEQVFDHLKHALIAYGGVGKKLEERFAAENIAADFNFAVALNSFFLLDDRVHQIPFFESNGRSEDIHLYGDLRDFSGTLLNTSFFYWGSNFSMQLNFYIQYPRLQSYFLGRMKGLMGISLAAVFIILGVFGFVVQTILKQKRLSDMKTDFINNITHELHTPLSTIAVATKNLKLKTVGENPQKLVDLAEVIERQNKRLQGIIDNVMKLSFFDKKEIADMRLEVDAHDLLAGLVRDFKVKYMERDLAVEENYRAKADGLSLEPSLFLTAVFNILDNAVKYTLETPRIRLHTWNDEKYFYLSITDNGTGIPRHAQKMIFEKFYRVPEGNIHKTKGLGIGLYTSRWIIEAHGGEITVSGKPEEGSVFTIKLPLERGARGIQT